MTSALATLLLMGAGFLHSFSFMCRKLPPARRPAAYPRRRAAQAAIDIGWMLLVAAGWRLAFALSFWAGFVAILLYFLVLPFVFQPPLARMMGFRSLSHYLEAADKK